MCASASWVRYSVGVMGSCGVLIAASRRMDSQGEVSRGERGVGAWPSWWMRRWRAGIRRLRLPVLLRRLVGATKMPTSCRPDGTVAFGEGACALMALMSSSVFYAGGGEDEADVGYAVFGASKVRRRGRVRLPCRRVRCGCVAGCAVCLQVVEDFRCFFACDRC